MKFVPRGLILAVLLSLAGCPRGDSSKGSAPPAQSTNGLNSQNGGDSTDPTPRSDKPPNTVADPSNHGGSAADENTRAWLMELGSGDPKVIKQASQRFAEKYKDGGQQVFREHLDDPNSTLRKGALWGALFGATGGFDSASEEMAAIQQAAMKDDDPGVRHVALGAINSLKDQRFANYFEVAQISRFVDDEQEPDPDNRALAARMLSRYGTRSPAALPALNKAVKNDPDPDVRSACLHAIYNIARNAEEALPAPTYVLQHDEDPRLRRIAANRLGSYKAASAPSVPQLIAALSDKGVPQRAPEDPLFGKDDPVCIAAANALARIGKPAVAPLMQSLNSDNLEVRLLTIRALGDIGPAAKDATVVLKRLANSPNAGEATAAKAALIRIGE